MKKIISILTASRAEYGLLKPIIFKLNELNEYDVRIVATGMHLSPLYGNTYQEIERDGVQIDKKIEILLGANTSTSVSKSMGLAMISFSEYFEELRPDLLIVLGDRYETLAVCCTAMNARIPIAHLHGGEATEGLIDEAIRHSITKMSFLHFTSTEEYRRRVIQLGEHPDRVFNVGALGVEVIKNSYDMLLTREELGQSLKFNLGNRYIVMTFHPVTLENETAEQQIINILQALDEFNNLKVIITKANADLGGDSINKTIDKYIESRKDRWAAFESLGQLRYLSALRYCECVIGNSSSGIIEVPSFKKPTINVGDRQKGRIQAKSIINCEPNKSDVVWALEKALSDKFKESLYDMDNPYGNGDTSNKIISNITKCFENNLLDLKKQFFDIKEGFILK